MMSLAAASALPAASVGVAATTGSAPLLIGAIVAVVIVLGVGVAVLQRLRQRRAYRHGHDFVLLLVRVPKEAVEKKEGQQERSIEEQIAPAEILFSILGGLRAERGLRAAWRGRLDHLAFEIVALHGLISFYIAVPKEAQQFVEEQIHAQYPAAQFEEVEDYNAFSPTGVALGAELALIHPPALPIRTYRHQDGDPLHALTNALSRLGDGESGTIQYVVRSAHPSWHKTAAKLSEQLRNGTTLRAALAGARAHPALRVLGGIARPPKGNGEQEQERAARQLTQSDQELIQQIEEKNNKAGLDVTIRLVVAAASAGIARARLQGLVDAFAQFRQYQTGNGFRTRNLRRDQEFMRQYIYRTMGHAGSCVLNAEEMAGLFHLPLPSTETPNINWLMARTLPAPVHVPQQGMLLGYNMFRGRRTLVHMKEDDRRRHMYIIGTTGVGKSNLMLTMAVQDIHNGRGVAVIDPHGSLVETILENIPDHRVDDVVYFDPADTERPVGLNMLEARTPQEADFAVQEMIAIFYKLVTDPSMIGPMFEHNMRNAMLTLMANPEHPGTIADIPRIFTDAEFQKYAVQFVTDPIVRAFWEKEMAKTTDYHKSEMLGYLISKVGRFVENSMMRNIIGQPQSGFNVREVMDQGKILLVNLSKGKVGEMNSNLLGLIIVAKLQMAALSRADLPEEQRRDFYLYVDEFQNFITDSIAIILSEARKYKLNLIMAHQYIGQLVVNNDTKVRDAVFGNVGTIASFRVGVDDAETLAQQLAPVVSEYDLLNLEKYHAYLRLLIDNAASKAFTLVTFPPPLGSRERATQLKVVSRLGYGRVRQDVEQEILVRTKLGSAMPVATPASESHG